MSYDIYLRDAENGETLEMDSAHAVEGGMYEPGDRRCWLNITYNYSRIFNAVLGEKGIRSIYGLTGAQSVLLLEGAIAQLAGEPDADYWQATEGNAKQALRGLLLFAKAHPAGVWDGD